MRHPMRVLNERVKENLTFSYKYPMMTCIFRKDNISFKDLDLMRNISMNGLIKRRSFLIAKIFPSLSLFSINYIDMLIIEVEVATSNKEPVSTSTRC